MNDLRKRSGAVDVEAVRKLGGLSFSRGQEIAYVMRKCGATYQEIGRALGVTRQAANEAVKAVERKL